MSVIVIDLETTGLDTMKDKVIEVAAMDMENNSQKLYFVPHHEYFSASQHGIGLSVSRYFERGVYQEMLSAADTRDYYTDLWRMLDGNTVAGSNPRFDTNFLMRVFTDMGLKPEPWHHRLLDLSAYATGVLNLPFDKMPGLATVCEALDIDFSEAHSAMGDVHVTRTCFAALRHIRGELRPV